MKFTPERMARIRRLVDQNHRNQRFVRELVKIRESKGLSQADIAKIIGVDPEFIAEFELFLKVPRMSHLRDYADALGYAVFYEARPIEDVAH